MTHLARALTVGFCVLVSGAAPSVAADAPQADAGFDRAQTRLAEGNRRFVKGELKSCAASGGAARTRLASGQKPYAIVLSCSDSRLPPEMVFDEGLGELFVVRVAGNIADPVVLGSIEYAAEHLGSKLVVVLGHERCGAVTAAVDSHGRASGNIGALMKALAPALKRARSAAKDAPKEQLVDVAVVENARLVADDLTKKSLVLKRLIAEGKLRIVAARYDLDDGTVSWIDSPGR